MTDNDDAEPLVVWDSESYDAAPVTDAAVGVQLVVPRGVVIVHMKKAPK